MKDLLAYLLPKIENNEVIPPFLFLWNSLESISLFVQSLIENILQSYHIPKNFFFHLKNSEETIKIDTLREYLRFAYLSTENTYQVFFFENLSRFTKESMSIMLKFLEEPQKYNIIFLSNTQESWILETILSRVQKYHLSFEKEKEYQEHIQKIVTSTLKKDYSLIISFLQNKHTTKQEYIDLLYCFLENCKYDIKNIFLITKIEQSIKNILYQNAIPKYEIESLLCFLYLHEEYE